MTRLKIAILGLLVLAGVAALLLIRKHDQARIYEKDEALSRQSDRIAQMESENQRLSNLVVRATNSSTESASPDSASSVSTSSESSRELLRLRGEVGLLRQQTNELGALRQDNDRLSKAIADSETTQTNQFSPEEQLIVRQTHAVDATGALLGAIKKYSANHDGQLPASLDQLIAFGATNLAGNLKFSDFIFGQDAGTDPQGKPAVLRLRVPLAKPGGGGLMIVGGIDDAGVPHTSIWNVSP